jgi:hypothetical protein
VHNVKVDVARPAPSGANQHTLELRAHVHVHARAKAQKHEKPPPKADERHTQPYSAGMAAHGEQQTTARPEDIS